MVKQTSRAYKAAVLGSMIVCALLLMTKTDVILVEGPADNNNNNNNNNKVDDGDGRTSVTVESPQLLTGSYSDDWRSDDDCPFNVAPELWSSGAPDQFEPPDCDNAEFLEQPSAVSAHLWTPAGNLTDEFVLDLVSDCGQLRRLFASKPLTDEEASFPLAYTFVGERNADQTLRLFRSLYWPQNVYCFTYDNKSSSVYQSFMRSLAACFPENVLLNPRPIDVYWGEDSVLRNVVPCLQLLADSQLPWRYAQVVSYNDFPLKTNLETVRILKILNGSNDCDLIEPIVDFYFYQREYRTELEKNEQKPLPPGGLLIFKGSYATTMSREFVRFTFDNPLAKRLYQWMNGTWCPEEHYWATLIHNLFLNAPGAFPGQCHWFYKHEGSGKRYLSRCQTWDINPIDGHACRGMSKHWSCVYGVDDVPWLMMRPELVGHKFYSEFQPAALYCLERWHWRKTCSRSTAYVEANRSYYDDLPAVRYQRAIDKEAFFC